MARGQESVRNGRSGAGSLVVGVAADAARMNLGEAGAATASLVLRNVNVTLLGKVLNQQKQDGRAAVQLIDGAADVAPPPRAPEPGKGALVDVTA
jgi:hypothetical protein